MNDKLRELLARVKDDVLRNQIAEAIDEYVGEVRNDSYDEGIGVGWDNAMETE